MQLNHTTDGRVTRLATARAIRGLTHAALGRAVGEDGLTVFRWETGKQQIPSTAMHKRLAMALCWDWRDLAGEPLAYDEAESAVIHGRKFPDRAFG